MPGDVRLEVVPHWSLFYYVAASYSVLNITGWSSYPDCWLFPQPAITLVSTDPAQTWQVAFTAGSDDKSAGKDVADAWCQYVGLREGLGGCGEPRLELVGNRYGGCVRRFWAGARRRARRARFGGVCDAYCMLRVDGSGLASGGI